MSHLFTLGFKIVTVGGIRFCFNGNTFNDIDAVPLQADQFFRVVGQQADLGNTESQQNLGADAVFA